MSIPSELSYFGVASPHIVIGSYVYVYMVLVGGVSWNILYQWLFPNTNTLYKRVHTVLGDGLLPLSTELSHRLLRLHLSDRGDDIDGLTEPHADELCRTGHP